MDMCENGKLIRNLKDAGLDDNAVHQFMALQKQGRTEEQRRLLVWHRASLLDQIHVSQHKIDCLDYLIYSMKKQTNKYTGGTVL